MAVSNYIPSKCKYDVRGLANGVYLLAASATKGIDIDNGEARIVSLSQAPIALEAYNVTINDTEELDERYEFSHSVSFSVNGYANELTIGERYYVIVKTKNGEYLLLNALFPCKVEYTYILGNGVSRTDFNMLTVSNHPTLPVVGYSFGAPHSCGYGYDKITRIRLNEKAYTKRLTSSIMCVNDGFSDVYFDNGAEYREFYNGEYVTQSLQFSIPLSTYKSSWHYNLLEFKDNKYVAIIETANGDVYCSGFMFGLQPSYSVTGESESSQIDITMEEASSDSFLSHSKADNANITIDTSTTWSYTDEYNGYECLRGLDGVAKYLLQRELNAFGEETGRFKVLSGYSHQFQGLNIVGTFNTVETFETAACALFKCKTGGTLPPTVILNISGECKTYTFSADCDWNFGEDVCGESIVVTPSSGLAGVLYEISFCYTSSRWVVSGYTCEGFDKYEVEYEYISQDGGETWIPTGNSRRGNVIEINSEDCGYSDECTITDVSVSPTSIQLTAETAQTLVTISSSGECETPLTWTAYKMISGDGGSWIPSLTPSGSGESGGYLTVSQSGRYHIYSDYDNSKYAVFTVTEVAPTPEFTMCVSGNQSTASVEVGTQHTVGTSKICDDNPPQCGIVYEELNTWENDVRLTFYYSFDNASITRISGLTIGGVVIGNASLNQQYTNGVGGYFTCYSNRIEEYAPNDQMTQIDCYLVLDNGEVVDFNSSLWGANR